MRHMPTDAPPASDTSVLPLELLHSIFSHVHADDTHRLSLVPLPSRRHVPLNLPKCRLVSKRWSSIVAPRLFARLIVRKGNRDERPKTGEERKRNEITFDHFLAFLASSPSAAYHVKSLVLTVWTPTEVEALLSAKILKAILSYLPRLEDLSLDSINLQPTPLESDALKSKGKKRGKGVLNLRKSLRAYFLRLHSNSGSLSPSSSSYPYSYSYPSYTSSPLTRTLTSPFKLLLHTHSHTHTRRPLLPRSQVRSTIFTLKKLSLHKVRLRQDNIDQLTSIFAAFSAIDVLSFSAVKVSPSPPPPLSRSRTPTSSVPLPTTTANAAAPPTDLPSSQPTSTPNSSSLSTYIQQTTPRTNHLAVLSLHIHGPGDVSTSSALIPLLERVLSFRRVRDVKVELDLYRDAPWVGWLVRSRGGGGGEGEGGNGLSGFSGLRGLSGVGGGGGGGSMMKNLTELVLDFNGIPWRRSALSSYEQHNATEITLNLGHHLPNLHRFKFIGTMPPPPSSIASLPSLASLSSLAHPSPSPTHSSSSSTMTSLAQFYLPTYSLPLSFLSNLPGNVAHVTLDVGYVPEFMWEEVSVRTRRLGRLRSLSVLVACEGGSLNGGRDGLLGVLERNGKGEVGGLERERVRWGTKELRERGVLYLGVSPSALVSSPSLLWHPQSPSPNPSENGGCEGEAEGEKTEMVDGAPSCRQFGCVVGGAGVERRRYLPLFLL